MNESLSLEWLLEIILREHSLEDGFEVWLDCGESVPMCPGSGFGSIGSRVYSVINTGNSETLTVGELREQVGRGLSQSHAADAVCHLNPGDGYLYPLTSSVISARANRFTLQGDPTARVPRP